MKKYKILLFVLAVVMSTFMSAAAQIEKHFNPEQDTLISCGANPADYTGMTFDGDVYVLLNGCADLKSTVIPGDNAFLTLRDIKVNGTLYFVDDTFDAAGGTYRESLTYDSLTHAHHYLNLAGNSYVENLYMECMNPHDCSLGLQYPSEINNLHIVPTNAAARGRIAVRGYIDPLVDIETDYYEASEVTSFPDLEFNSFDNEYAKIILDGFDVYKKVARDIACDGILYGSSRLRDKETLHFIYTNRYSNQAEIPVIESFLQRGKVNNLYIFNKYLIGSGEMNIDLINLFIEITMITNGKDIGSTTITDFTRIWVPILRAGGYTNIGIVSVYSQLKTDVIQADKTTFPLYIDAMVVGTEGLTEKITLKSTKIAMLNYLGGLSPYSVLNINFVSPDKGHLLHIPSIGILMAHGGRINLESKSYYTDILHVGTFWLMNGREDFRYATDKNGVSSAAAFLDLPVSDDNTSRETLFIENARETRLYLTQFYNDYFSFEYGDIYFWTLTQSTNSVGSNWIAYMLDKFSSLASEGVKQAYTTKIRLGAISFGDLVIDQVLDEKTNSSWFSASCAVHMFGDFYFVTK